MVRIDAIGRIEAKGNGEYRVFMKSGSRFVSSRSYGDRVRQLIR
jgi:hypothetical protein